MMTTPQQETKEPNQLEQKRAYLQQQANDLIMIAENQSHCALSLLHKINVLGGTTEKAYQTVQARIFTDNDVHAAYHAIALTQQTPCLPFDIPKLVELILASPVHGKSEQHSTEKAELLLRLIKLFDREPLNTPPIPQIKQAILNCGDTAVIDALHQHLAGKK